MKFINGNVEFTDNMKQLLPDISIFDRIISNDPTILENKLWRKQMGISSVTGLSSGSVKTTTDNIFYRSCYLIYKSGATIPKADISLVVKNVNSNETIPSSEFNNWGLIQLEDNLYLLFIWIDVEQSYVFNLANGTLNPFNTNDWFIQVVV